MFYRSKSRLTENPETDGVLGNFLARAVTVDRRIWFVLMSGVLLGGGWDLQQVLHHRQEARERALYGGVTIQEWVDQALDRYRRPKHWKRADSQDVSVVAEQRLIEIGAPAVPELVRQLRGLHTSAVHEALVNWRTKHFPQWLSYPKYLEIPRDVSGDAAIFNSILSRMGEAARPALPAMLDSRDDLHVWAYYELLNDLVNLGPAAGPAVPRLKQWAGAGDVYAARAVKYLQDGVYESVLYVPRAK